MENECHGFCDCETFTSSNFIYLVSHNTDTPIYLFLLGFALSVIIKVFLAKLITTNPLKTGVGLTENITRIPSLLQSFAGSQIAPPHLRLLFQIVEQIQRKWHL